MLGGQRWAFRGLDNVVWPLLSDSNGGKAVCAWKRKEGFEGVVRRRGNGVFYDSNRGGAWKGALQPRMAALRRRDTAAKPSRLANRRVELNGNQAAGGSNDHFVEGERAGARRAGCGALETTRGG